jgi:hypothetical protein
VNVADEFFEIDLFLTYDRLIAVLKELARAPVAAVEGNHVSGKEFAH